MKKIIFTVISIYLFNFSFALSQEISTNNELWFSNLSSSPVTFVVYPVSTIINGFFVVSLEARLKNTQNGDHDFYYSNGVYLNQNKIPQTMIEVPHGERNKGLNFDDFNSQTQAPPEVMEVLAVEFTKLRFMHMDKCIILIMNRMVD